MKLERYLQRINYTGSRKITIDTLRELHRAHLFAIPYENLDIHLGRPLRLELDHIYHKLVEERRGGWCYEMNGLFAWALCELGFAVTLLGSSVGQPAKGAGQDMDHLILLVQLEQPWLVDVGFGNGFLEPLPLLPGNYRLDFLDFRLEQQNDTWYFHNHLYGAQGYGFGLDPRLLPSFAPGCHTLQTSPESGFVRMTVCHRFTPQGLVSLRGATLKHITAAGVGEEEIQSPQRYAEVLGHIFGLDSALATALWDKVWQRHMTWKQEQAHAQSSMANAH